MISLQYLRRSISTEDLDEELSILLSSHNGKSFVIGETRFMFNEEDKLIKSISLTGEYPFYEGITLKTYDLNGNVLSSRSIDMNLNINLLHQYEMEV
jgi:hypothetical protein